jgi:hypothetical protein
MLAAKERAAFAELHYAFRSNLSTRLSKSRPFKSLELASYLLVGLKGLD